MSKRYRDRGDPTPEDVERRRMIYGWTDQRGVIRGGWPVVLNDAHKGDAKALCDYLRRPDLTLGLDKREQLADLIERCVHHRIGKEATGASLSRRATRILSPWMKSSPTPAVKCKG
jgi:hypothetical protein